MHMDPGNLLVIGRYSDNPEVPKFGSRNFSSKKKSAASVPEVADFKALRLDCRSLNSNSSKISAA